ncbi:MAG: YihA family ribosome biogenesis GTP-binding protein [Gemmatimonadetes bacterium]|nr:MAG: YihA family ribosome biogenesis GTP-binding protein [Gemmatimonadota bacterium]
MVTIKTVDFVISAASPAQFPKQGLPEIAFAGRSNVGKSSAINALLNRKRLAFTSSTPGRTQTLNFYRINNAFFFVDLPGYGYSKVSKAMRRQWVSLMNDYFSVREVLNGVVVVTDIRHPLSKLDIDFIQWVRSFSLPHVIVATKADKLSRHQIRQQHGQFQRQAVLPPDLVIPFSAKTRAGKTEVWKQLSENFLSA